MKNNNKASGKNTTFKKWKVQTINLATYDADIEVVYNKTFTKKDEKKFLAVTYTFSDFSDTTQIQFNMNKPLDVNTIYHEVLHAVRFELNYKRGTAYLARFDDETLPYTCGYVANEIIKFCQKNKIIITLV
jgi:hypothetical protein